MKIWSYQTRAHCSVYEGERGFLITETARLEPAKLSEGWSGWRKRCRDSRTERRNLG